MTRRVSNAVILTGADCALLYSAARLHELRNTTRVRADRLHALLTDISAAAVLHASSVEGTKPRETTENDEAGSNEEVATVAAVAKRAGLTPRAVRNHINAGILHATLIGRTWVIAPADADQYIEGRKAA